MLRFSRFAFVLPLLMAIVCSSTLIHAADQKVKIVPLKEKGIAFLKASQNEDGSWTNAKILGITGLVLDALLEAGVDVDDPVVKKGLDFLLSYKQPDGGIYSPTSNHKNYETSIAVSALSAGNKDKRFDETIKGAVKYLKEIQWDSDEGAKETDTAFGGQGYGSHKRPDLSNTAFFLDALHSAGISQDDPAMKKALVFVSRCQNLSSEHNTTGFADKINDGGFYYTPAAGGSSQAGKDEATGGLRSYASMTYAGLKSMIYAGLTKDDPRVKAASTWLKKNYSLTENPGMGQQGMFYYYHTMSKTLKTLGEPTFTTEDGVSHDWKADLVETLSAKQAGNGSWVNQADRWYEGDPNLVTAYVLMALSNCE
jgi:squalene-hopene/tetraprenyl-beta-curcumene cyclase